MAKEKRDPKVVIYPDKAGEYRWRLIGGNGEIQATGEGFETEEHAKESVDSVAGNFAAVSGTLYDSNGDPTPVDNVHVDVEIITTKEAADFDEQL